MTQIPGISIKKNAAGKITHITIDVELQQELAQPLLNQVKMVMENDFDLAFANGHTLEESEAIVVAAVKAHYANHP